MCITFQMPLVYSAFVKKIKISQPIRRQAGHLGFPISPAKFQLNIIEHVGEKCGNQYSKYQKGHYSYRN